MKHPQPETVTLLCVRCFQRAPHRLRKDRGTPEATCRTCRIESSARWRRLHPLETKLRSTWSGILERCLNPKHPKFKKYGGSGIVVCERWQGEGGFEHFVEDMGSPPSLEHTVDRIDFKGNYEPENCRWATYAEQARNREANRFITHDGVTLCLVDWGTKLGVPWRRIQDRLDAGWAIEDALVDDEVPF